MGECLRKTKWSDGLFTMIKIHPLFFLFVFLMVIEGYIMQFSIYILALLWHEIGHLLVIFSLRVKVKYCIIFPLGGEIALNHPYAISHWHKLLIASGGVIFSFFGFLLSGFIDGAHGQLLKQANILLLAVNLLPIWPLDGGRMVVYAVQLFTDNDVYSYVYKCSFILLFIMLIASIVLLPATFFILFHVFFLLLQLLNEWQYHPYKVALEKMLYSKLT